MKKFWFCQAQIWYEIQDWSPNQTFCYRIGKNKVFHSCELLKQSSSNYSIKCKLTGNDWKALYFWVLSKVSIPSFLENVSHLKGFNFKCTPLIWSCNLSFLAKSSYFKNLCLAILVFSFRTCNIGSLIKVEALPYHAQFQLESCNTSLPYSSRIPSY